VSDRLARLIEAEVLAVEFDYEDEVEFDYELDDSFWGVECPTCGGECRL